MHSRIETKLLWSQERKQGTKNVVKYNTEEEKKNK